MSHGRSLRKKLFGKSTNQRWGKPNHLTATSCSERSIHKKRTAATDRHHPFAKTKSAHRGAFASRTKCTAVQPQAQSAEQQRTQTHEHERLLGLGGRQHDGAAPYVIRIDQAVGADLLFSRLLLLLLCKPGRAAARMVYGAARIPPWRRAPPLAHVCVVAVRAAWLESWPRLLSTRLGSGSKLVLV